MECHKACCEKLVTPSIPNPQTNSKIFRLRILLVTCWGLAILLVTFLGRSFVTQTSKVNRNLQLGDKKVSFSITWGILLMAEILHQLVW